MIYLAAAATVGVFIFALRLFAVVPVANDILRLTGEATATMRAADLDDEVKERVIQSAAGKLLLRFVSITLRSLAALALPTLVLWLLDAVGVVGMDAVMAFLMRVDVIVGLTVVLLAVWFLWRRRTNRA